MTKHASIPLALMLAVFGTLSLGCGDDDSGSSGSGGSGDGVMVFVTSGRADGDFGGIAGADALCTAYARSVGLSGSWVAWLSATNGPLHAKDRILDAEYRLVDGTTVVASDKAQLTTPGVDLDNAISMDEKGDTVAADVFVWTGTGNEGLNLEPNCIDWSRAQAGDMGRIGDATDSRDPFWTDIGTGSIVDCDEMARLYCFSDDLVTF